MPLLAPSGDTRLSSLQVDALSQEAEFLLSITADGLAIDVLRRLARLGAERAR